MEFPIASFGLDKVQLKPSLFKDRFELALNYILSLKDENLLQNFYLEAGIKKDFHGALRTTQHGSGSYGDDLHWGWESPTCELRGHFLGHWLSAAAAIYKATGDLAVKLKADRIVAGLKRCQEKNGRGWVGSSPEKYLEWTAQGQPTWAPQYVHHKTLMGLFDMYALAGNADALMIADKFATWFYEWTNAFSREEMDNILDVETGGMLEVWANLYEATHHAKYLTLIERYTRSRLFDPLLNGDDILTNKHANTTIVEAQGAARVYEVTKDERWRKIVEAYWKSAVTDRGEYCTGGQTNGEVWTPPFEFSARLGDKNQEHCVVYNMMRLADYLFRWTGDPAYADYIERNLYNGILAQQNMRTGMVAYFLPLGAGGKKVWGSPTYDFWCCHGTMVQAQTTHNAYVYYEENESIFVCQYIPSVLETAIKGTRLTIQQDSLSTSNGSASNNSGNAGARHRPDAWHISFSIQAAQPTEFTLKLRLPWWLNGPAKILVNSETIALQEGVSGFVAIQRVWANDTITLELPTRLFVSPLPDDPTMCAFMDGPIVLAGLSDSERRLIGNKDDALSILTPDNEREWGNWLPGYRVRNQVQGLRFKPLYQIIDEVYTVYFPICSPDH
ncbi:MAG: beta-L-arabinofuranosidase domain-containing protein [Chloroflexota bacterium]